MNYYPNNNFYQGYSNYNAYQPAGMPTAALQGKIVDSLDMVKANEVPFGGFGIFPKGDLSEIYIKSWNSNGTTQINTYKPVPKEESVETKENNSTSELLEKINNLNEKLDLLISEKQNTPQKVTPIVKDAKVNAY